MENSIEGFTGRYRFLSNFFPSPMIFDQFRVETAEHAYQLSKASVVSDKSAIASAESPAKAKRLGRQKTCRPDWDDVKVDVMRRVVLVKFLSSDLLSHLLLNTGEAYLEETNNWGDTFWGVCDNRGLNKLGRILMETREKIREIVR